MDGPQTFQPEFYEPEFSQNSDVEVGKQASSPLEPESKGSVIHAEFSPVDFSQEEKHGASKEFSEEFQPTLIASSIVSGSGTVPDHPPPVELHSDTLGNDLHDPPEAVSAESRPDEKILGNNLPTKTYGRRSLGSVAPPQLPDFSEIDLSLGSIGSQAWVSTKDRDLDILKEETRRAPEKKISTTPPLSPKKSSSPSKVSGSPKKKVSFQVIGLSDPSDPLPDPEPDEPKVSEPPSAPELPQHHSKSLSESGEVLDSKSGQSSGPSPSVPETEAAPNLEEPQSSRDAPPEYVPITQAPEKSSSEAEASPEPKKPGKRKPAAPKKEKPAKRVVKPEKDKPVRKSGKVANKKDTEAKKSDKGKKGGKLIELDLSSPKKDASSKLLRRGAQKEAKNSVSEEEEKEDKEESPKLERQAKKRSLPAEASPKRQKISNQPLKSAGVEEIVESVWDALPSNYPLVEVPEKTKRLIKPEKLSGLFRGFSIIITGMKEDELDATLVLLLQKGGAKILDHPDEILNAARHEEASPKKKSPVKLPPRVLLLADKDHRTSKYLLCLASGLPCLHFNWAFHSVRQNCLIPDWEHYLLPSGFSSVENRKVFL